MAAKAMNIFENFFIESTLLSQPARILSNPFRRFQPIPLAQLRISDEAVSFTSACRRHIQSGIMRPRLFEMPMRKFSAGHISTVCRVVLFAAWLSTLPGFAADTANASSVQPYDYAEPKLLTGKLYAMGSNRKE